MKQVFIMLLIVLFFLTGCSIILYEHLTEGVIHDMKHEPEYTEIVLIQIYSSSGIITFIPITQYTPDKYVITIRNKDTMPADYVFSDYHVSEAVYQQYRIGDYFSSE